MQLAHRYNEWVHRVAKLIVAQFGHAFFFQKKVLDLGAGSGDLAGALFRLGADVLAVDAREYHLQLIRKKFPGMRTQKVDLDHEWPFRGQKFDLVLSVDIAPHLKDCETHIKQLVSIAPNIILETSTINTDDLSKTLQYQENRNEPTFSSNGFGSMTSAAKIESILNEYKLSFRRFDDAALNTDPYIYNWQVNNNLEALPKNRRLWIIGNPNQSSIEAPKPNQQPITPLASIDPPKISTPKFFKLPLEQRNRNVRQTPRPTRVPQAWSNATQLTSRAPRPATVISPGTKIRLFFNYYEDQNDKRQQEIDYCLQRNIENSAVDLVVVSSDTNPTFDFLISKINRLTKDGEIAIIAHSDIFLDSTISLVNKLNNKEVYALTRWEYDPNKEAKLIETNQGQDCWIFRGPIKDVKADFQIGKPGSDHRFAHQLQEAGYTVKNPCRSIKTYHYHSSGVHSYTEDQRIAEPYAYIEQSLI
jgi:SAM-dependent methyltransferase